MTERGVAEFHDGDQIYVKMYIRSPGNNTKDLLVMPNHFQSLSFKHERGNAGRANINLYDETFDRLEDVVINSGLLDPKKSRARTTQPIFLIQWGWANGAKSPVWEITVHNYRSHYQLGKGTNLEFRCVGGLSNSLFRRGNFYFERGTLLSTVIEKIAKNNEIKFEVEEGVMVKSSRQNNRSDMRWLKQMLGGGAFQSLTGNTNYGVWIRHDGNEPVLVVRTNAGSRARKEWNFIYGRDKDGQVLDWEVELQSNTVFAMGAGGFQATIFDPRKKENKKLIVNSRTQTGVAGAGKIVPEDSTTPAPLRVGFQDESSARSYAADKWMKLNMTNVTGRLTILGNPIITPDDLVNVIMITGVSGITDLRDIHPTSGSYEITSIEHNVTESDYTTILNLARRGNLVAGMGGTEKSTGSQDTGTTTANEAIVKLNKVSKDNTKEARKRKLSQFLDAEGSEALRDSAVGRRFLEGN